MIYRVDRKEIQGRSCTFFVPAGEGPFPAVCLCVGEPEDLMETLLSDLMPPAVWFHAESDWSRDYTPWPAEGLPGRAPFSGGAAAHLAYLEEAVLPVLHAAYPVLPGSAHCAAAGYSLGGLFALWTVYESRSFGSAASLSGSLWYDGWRAYAEDHAPGRGKSVYLSLGRSEERTGNPRMGSVGENTRFTFARLQDALGEENVMLEWNRGGHFTGIPHRWQKSMEWLLPRLN